MSDTIGIELRQKLENPLEFQGGGRGIGIPAAATVIHGLDVALRTDTGKAVIGAKSEGKLPCRNDTDLSR
ncbi:MAG: hypothetical protein ACREC9_15100 [Methylocella sp.]